MQASWPLLAQSDATIPIICLTGSWGRAMLPLMRKLNLGTKKCLYCGRMYGRQHYSNGRREDSKPFKQRKFCCHLHALKWNAGSHHYNWKGGIAHYKIGYIVHSKTKKGIHRIVMERFIGRPLKCSEVIHHRDHDKANNNPKNLQIMSQSEHAKAHAVHRLETLDLGPKKCVRCKHKFYRGRTPCGDFESPARFHQRNFCSRACRYPINRNIHRIMMKKYIGRKLKHHEIVQHIDGDTTNNNQSNLRIVLRRDFAREQAEKAHGWIGSNHWRTKKLAHGSRVRP